MQYLSRLCFLVIMTLVLLACGVDDPTFTPGERIDASTQPLADAETSCPGCLEPDGTCRNGNAEEACGGGGAVCQVCSGGETCEEQVCTAPPACNPDHCTGCCDSDGECVTGVDSANQCGVGGAECTQCSSGICETGVCKQECSPATCTGCCNGPTIDDCLPAQDGGGQSDSLCGLGGNSCMSCGGAATCTEGACVDISCSDSCPSGCCDGASCVSGNDAALCGNSGNACVACATGLTCSAAGVCETDLESLWDFVILSADVDAWDPFGGAPDVRITVDIGDSPGFSGSTAPISNQHFPVYSAPNGQIAVANVPARVILEKYKFTIDDVDTFLDDLMSEIVEETPASSIFSGNVLVQSVGAGENVFVVRYKLVQSQL